MSLASGIYKKTVPNPPLWVMICDPSQVFLTENVVITRGPSLKGQCHEIFCFWFFLWISFPPAPEYTIRTDTGGKFATGINDTGGKFCHQFPLYCCHRFQPHRRQICRRCRWHWWQIMRTISGCWHLKVNLKAKIYIYVNSTIQRCPNKIIKIFLLEDFFHLPLVSLTPVVHLEPWISPRIFAKKSKWP